MIPQSTPRKPYVGKDKQSEKQKNNKTPVMRGHREGGTLERNLFHEDKPSSVFSVVAV
jgi:hypothetical protein